MPRSDSESREQSSQYASAAVIPDQRGRDFPLTDPSMSVDRGRNSKGPCDPEEAAAEDAAEEGCVLSGESVGAKDRPDHPMVHGCKRVCGVDPHSVDRLTPTSGIVKLPLQALKLSESASVPSPTFLLLLDHPVLLHSPGETAVDNDGEKLVGGRAKCNWTLIGQQLRGRFLRHQRHVALFPRLWEVAGDQGTIDHGPKPLADLSWEAQQKLVRHPVWPRRFPKGQTREQIVEVSGADFILKMRVVPLWDAVAPLENGGRQLGGSREKAGGSNLAKVSALVTIAPNLSRMLVCLLMLPA
eukprot:2042579-Rhodomonas_salina.1